MIKSIGIIGYGMEGRAVASYFRNDARIVIFDKDKPKNLESGFEYIPFDPKSKKFLIPSHIKTIYKSPGVPSSLVKLTSPDQVVSCFANLFFSLLPSKSRVIAVTGSKGKSTTSYLISELLKYHGKKAELIGNIGTLPDLNNLEADYYVVEMSSYQLEFFSYRSEVAVFTSFFADHLDHHGSLNKYLQAKLNITKTQKTTDYLIYPEILIEQVAKTNPELSKDIIKGASFKTIAKQIKLFQTDLINFESQFLGKHNLWNINLAYKVLQTIGLQDFSKDSFQKVLLDIQPLPGRLQKIVHKSGKIFFIDSLTTNPESVIEGIKAISEKYTIATLITGGQDRGLDYTKYCKYLNNSQINNFILWPETGKQIKKELKNKNSIYLGIQDSNELVETSIKEALSLTPAGEVCLISNGAASYNIFKNYSHKSDLIKKLLKDNF